MKTISLISAATLALTLAATANAASGNGADGWYELQQRQTNDTTQTTQKSAAERASADEYAARAISANQPNYKR